MRHSKSGCGPNPSRRNSASPIWTASGSRSYAARAWIRVRMAGTSASLARRMSMADGLANEGTGLAVPAKARAARKVSSLPSVAHGGHRDTAAANSRAGKTLTDERRSPPVVLVLLADEDSDGQRGHGGRTR